MKKFKNESEFWDTVKRLYEELLAKQMPDLQQGCPMYSFAIKLNDNIKQGSYFLIPNTYDYYALSDYDVVVKGNDDRERFIEDMQNAESVFQFLAENSRNFINPNDGLFWRRVYLFKDNKEVEEFKIKQDEINR